MAKNKSKVSKNKIIYVGVPDYVYGKAKSASKRQKMTLGEYVFACIAEFGDFPSDAFADIEPSLKKKSLFCRVTEEDYEMIKSKAAKMEVKISELVIASVMEANEEVIQQKYSPPRKTKAIYCRITDEMHELVMRKSKERCISASDYVLECIKLKIERDEADKIKKRRKKEQKNV